MKLDECFMHGISARKIAIYKDICRFFSKTTFILYTCFWRISCICFHSYRFVNPKGRWDVAHRRAIKGFETGVVLSLGSSSKLVQAKGQCEAHRASLIKLRLYPYPSVVNLDDPLD